jgi:hypothetical protein
VGEYACWYWLDGGGGGEGVPLLGLEVTVIGALDLACLHEDLGRRAVDALLEACLPSVSPSFPEPPLGCVLPVHDMAAGSNLPSAVKVW